MIRANVRGVSKGICHPSSVVWHAWSCSYLLSRRRIHRERLRNDLAVVHDESVGTQWNIISYLPGDVGDVPVDPQALERKTVDSLGRQRGDEALEETVDLLPSAIDPGFGAENRVIGVVTHYDANGLSLDECHQMITDNGFRGNRANGHEFLQE